MLNGFNELFSNDLVGFIDALSVFIDIIIGF